MCTSYNDFKIAVNRDTKMNVLWVLPCVLTSIVQSLVN